MEQKELPKIYCDLDNCISDWEKAFINISGGISVEKYEKENGKRSYNILIAKEGIKFWSEMSWTKDGKELWNFIKKYNSIILSAPVASTDKGYRACIDGKKIWMKNNLPGVKYILERNKHKYADNNSILIDDFKRNIELWNSAGDIGILHKSVEKTINKLKEIGFS